MDFKRLGVMGDWDRPYMTMQPFYEAEQLRAFAQILRNGHVYKGLKPVHWCLDCRSALAEAEVEYEDRVSPAIDVRFAVKDVADLAKRARSKRLNPDDVTEGTFTITNPGVFGSLIGFAVITAITVFARVIALTPGWGPLALAVHGVGVFVEYLGWTIGLGAAAAAFFDRRRRLTPPPLPAHARAV